MIRSDPHYWILILYSQCCRLFIYFFGLNNMETFYHFRCVILFNLFPTLAEDVGNVALSKSLNFIFGHIMDFLLLIPFLLIFLFVFLCLLIENVQNWIFSCKSVIILAPSLFTSTYHCSLFIFLFVIMDLVFILNIIDFWVGADCEREHIPSSSKDYKLGVPS